MDWSFWIGTAIGIAGILFGYYWYVKAKVTLDPRYNLSEDLILDPTAASLLGEVSVSFRGAPLRQLRRCNLLLWNAGKQTFKMSDLAPSSSDISVILSGPVIGDADVVSSRRECAPFVTTEDNLVHLGFDFLDRGDTILVSFLFDGPPDPPPILRAAVMGVPTGLRRTQGDWHVDDEVNRIIRPDEFDESEDEAQEQNRRHRSGVRIARRLLIIAVGILLLPIEILLPTPFAIATVLFTLAVITWNMVALLYRAVSALVRRDSVQTRLKRLLLRWAPLSGLQALGDSHQLPQLTSSIRFLDSGMGEKPKKH